MLEPIQQAHKFQTLDALRGVAALLVVAFHYGDFFGWTPQRGYAAVDMFFGLSGFVLSYAYQNRLDRGMTTGSFLKARVIRLAPLYILGLALGCVSVFLTKEYSAANLSGLEYLKFAGLGLLLLPSHTPQPHLIGAFPYNVPCWSLFLELLINIVHALLFRRLSTRFLSGICALSGTVLSGLYFHERYLNGGWAWNDLFTLGIARVFFSYTAGMLIYRVWSWRRDLVKVPAWLIVLATVALLGIHAPHDTFTSWLLIMFVFPVMIYSGACTEPGRHFKNVFGVLGGCSYGIYVLHFPFFKILIWLLKGTSFFTWQVAWALLAVLVAMCLLLDEVYDIPVRKALRGK